MQGAAEEVAMTRQSPLLQFDDGELRHSFDRKQQVELSPEQFGRNKVVEVSPSNRAAKKIRCFAPALPYGRLGLAAIRRRPSPNKGEALDYPAADIQDVEHNDK